MGRGFNFLPLNPARLSEIGAGEYLLIKGDADCGEFRELIGFGKYRTDYFEGFFNRFTLPQNGGSLVQPAEFLEPFRIAVQ